MGPKDCCEVDASNRDPRGSITSSAVSPPQCVKVGCVAIVGAVAAPKRGNAQVKIGPTELRMFRVDDPMRSFGPPKSWQKEVGHGQAVKVIPTADLVKCRFELIGAWHLAGASLSLSTRPKVGRRQRAAIGSSCNCAGDPESREERTVMDAVRVWPRCLLRPLGVSLLETWVESANEALQSWNAQCSQSRGGVLRGANRWESRVSHAYLKSSCA